MLVLLVGCGRNITEEVCSILKHSNPEENETINYEGGVCVMEEENYTNILSIKCPRYFDYFLIVAKYDINDTNMTSINEIKDKCTMLYEGVE